MQRTATQLRRCSQSGPFIKLQQRSSRDGRAVGVASRHRTRSIHRCSLAAPCAASHSTRSCCSLPARQLSSVSARLCSGIESLPAGSSSQRQSHPAGSGRRGRRLSLQTVSKARPPRMRGQACDLKEKPCSTALPAVDWRRYHLNVMFVDRCGPTRSSLTIVRPHT